MEMLVTEVEVTKAHPAEGREGWLATRTGVLGPGKELLRD